MSWYRLRQQSKAILLDCTYMPVWCPPSIRKFNSNLNRNQFKVTNYLQSEVDIGQETPCTACIVEKTSEVTNVKLHRCHCDTRAIYMHHKFYYQHRYNINIMVNLLSSFLSSSWKEFKSSDLRQTQRSSRFNTQLHTNTSLKQICYYINVWTIARVCR